MPSASSITSRTVRVECGPSCEPSVKERGRVCNRNHQFRGTVMKAVFVTCLVLIGLTAPLYANAAECTSSLDCGANRCCVICPTKYSTPHCEDMRREGDVCRPSGVPFNTTVSYPDGPTRLTNVYYILCPCAQGLFCNARAGGICSNSNEQDNLLSHDNEPQED